MLIICFLLFSCSKQNAEILKTEVRLVKLKWDEKELIARAEKNDFETENWNWDNVQNYLIPDFSYSKFWLLMSKKHPFGVGFLDEIMERKKFFPLCSGEIQKGISKDWSQNYFRYFLNLSFNFLENDDFKSFNKYSFELKNIFLRCSHVENPLKNSQIKDSFSSMLLKIYSKSKTLLENNTNNESSKIFETFLDFSSLDSSFLNKEEMKSCVNCSDNLKFFIEWYLKNRNDRFLKYFDIFLKEKTNRKDWEFFFSDHLIQKLETYESIFNDVLNLKNSIPVLKYFARKLNSSSLSDDNILEGVSSVCISDDKKREVQKILNKKLYDLLIKSLKNNTYELFDFYNSQFLKLKSCVDSEEFFSSLNEYFNNLEIPNETSLSFKLQYLWISSECKDCQEKEINKVFIVDILKSENKYKKINNSFDLLFKEKLKILISGDIDDNLKDDLVKYVNRNGRYKDLVLDEILKKNNFNLTCGDKKNINCEILLDHYVSKKDNKAIRSLYEKSKTYELFKNIVGHIMKEELDPGSLGSIIVESKKYLDIFFKRDLFAFFAFFNKLEKGFLNDYCVENQGLKVCQLYDFLKYKNNNDDSFQGFQVQDIPIDDILSKRIQIEKDLIDFENCKNLKCLNGKWILFKQKKNEFCELLTERKISACFNIKDIEKLEEEKRNDYFQNPFVVIEISSFDNEKIQIPQDPKAIVYQVQRNEIMDLSQEDESVNFYIKLLNNNFSGDIPIFNLGTFDLSLLPQTSFPEKILKLGNDVKDNVLDFFSKDNSIESNDVNNKKSATFFNCPEEDQSFCRTLDDRELNILNNKISEEKEKENEIEIEFILGNVKYNKENANSLEGALEVEQ